MKIVLIIFFFIVSIHTAVASPNDMIEEFDVKAASQWSAQFAWHSVIDETKGLKGQNLRIMDYRVKFCIDSLKYVGKQFVIVAGTDSNNLLSKRTYRRFPVMTSRGCLIATFPIKYQRKARGHYCSERLLFPTYEVFLVGATKKLIAKIEGALNPSDDRFTFGFDTRTAALEYVTEMKRNNGCLKAQKWIKAE